MNTLFLQSFETAYLVMTVMQTVCMIIAAFALVFTAATYFLEPFLGALKSYRESHKKKFEQTVIEKLNQMQADIDHLKNDKL